MSKEKQIEEMAWDLCDIPKHPSIESCEQCGNKRCHAMYYAERAYNAGYLKQSEGGWIVKGECWKTLQCSACGHTTDTIYDKSPFCPNCGAKMKGGAE